jgi:hypothetical protein
MAARSRCTRCFFGMAFHHLSRELRTRPGIDFCARDVLRLGAGLLGARISATQIAALGWGTALLVAGGVVSTLLLALWLGRLLGLGSARATLAGGAVAICGASAALAISAVLPPERKGDRYTLTVVMSITLLSTASMILYPLLARVLHLSPAQAGIFLGGSIHDVAQVVGAGFTLGTETGELATVVKLFRVAMLAGVGSGGVAGLSLGTCASAGRGAGRPRAGAPAAGALVPVAVHGPGGAELGWASWSCRCGWKPTQTINYVIGVAAGGSVDLYARGIKSALETLNLVNGQTVVADNKPGAGGLLALQQLQRRRGNAHNLGTFHTGSHRRTGDRHPEGRHA